MENDIIWHVDNERNFNDDKQWYTFVEDLSELKDINDDEKEISGIEYDESIILDPNIAVVCIMGPSRNGKSTIVNDILGVKDACKVSSTANVAQTKGAWITKYSSNKHNVSQIVCCICFICFY